MLGFEQILMQVVANGTTAEIAGDAFVNSINSIMGSITALVIAVSGIVVAIIARRSSGRTRTDQEAKTIAAAEALQLVMQKLQENEGRISTVGKATLGLATTDEQRQMLDREVAPVVNTGAERINTIGAQIPAIKEMLGVTGVAADVNARKDMPRESTSTLAKINETQRRITEEA